MSSFEQKVDSLWEKVLERFQAENEKEWLYDMNETLLNGYKVYINN